MSEDINGVFVRLPLSEEQKDSFYSRHYTGDPTPGLIAIGTPVASGELEVVGYITNNRPFGTNTLTHWILYKHRQYDREYGVVRQSDAQAALAAAQAEIVRLAEENERLKHIAYSGRGSLSYTIHSPARFADEERKGPAA